jgi:hypothetical protein
MRRFWHVLRFITVWIGGDLLILLGIGYAFPGLSETVGVGALIGCVLGAVTVGILNNTPWGILEMPPASNKV